MASVFKTVLLSSLSLAASVKNTKESRQCAIKSNTSWSLFNWFKGTCMGDDEDDDIYKEPEEIVLKLGDYFDVDGNGTKEATPLSILLLSSLIPFQYKHTEKIKDVSWYTYGNCHQDSFQPPSIEDAVMGFNKGNIQTLEYINICFTVRNVKLMGEDDGVVLHQGVSGDVHQGVSGDVPLSDPLTLNCPCLRFEFQAELELGSGTWQTVWIPFGIDQDGLEHLRIASVRPALGHGFGAAPETASPADVLKDALYSASTST